MVYQERRRRTKPQEQTPPERQLKKAKQKALRLLERMDRTEAQLLEKLMEAGFSREIADQAMAYVRSFGYLNDARYARNYIESRRGRKSRRQLEQELEFQKGVSKELIRSAYEELEPVDEREAIRRALQKKRRSSPQCDESQRQKLIASLLRKGFDLGDILSVMKETL